MCRLNTQAHLGDLDGLAKNEPMIDGVKYEPTKVSFINTSVVLSWKVFIEQSNE